MSIQLVDCLLLLLVLPMQTEQKDHGQEHGACIVIVATDAPLDSHRLARLASRAAPGLGAAGSPISHGSGDSVPAFSAANGLLEAHESAAPLEHAELLRDDQRRPLFPAVRDATEETVVNGLLQACAMTGQRGRKLEDNDPARAVRNGRESGTPSGGSDETTRRAAAVRSEARTYGAAALAGPLNERVAAFEKQLPRLMRQHRVPGAAVAVLSDSRLVWSRGFGVRCAGSHEVVQPETVMEACSMSKPFFAYLLLKLVESKRFDLDRPLVEYLGADYLAGDPRHRRITARMVLAHTSGLPNWRAGGWRSGAPLSLGFEPGEKFRYSGEGFLMLQRALERAMSTDLDTLSRERLITPLGLENTRFVWDERFVLRSCCGHDRAGKVKTGRRYYDRANAAFTLYTSVEDYARFLAEILGRDRSAPHSLSAATRAEMLTPVSHREEQQADWGLGWGLRMVHGRRRVYHSGSNGSGFRCYSEFSLDRGDGLVIMTNAVGGKELWKAAAEQWHAGSHAEP